MKRTVGAATLALVSIPALAIHPKQQTPLYVEGQVIVKYRGSASTDSIKSLNSNLALQTVRSLGRTGNVLMRLPSTMSVASALQTLRADPAVESVQPNFLKRKRTVLPNDGLFTTQWGLDNTGQANFVSGGPAGTPGGDLNLLPAWDPAGNGSFPQTGDGSVEVAIVDDGYQTDHPDLAANFLPGVSFLDGGGTSSDVSPQDDHGTEVAGALGAIGNNGQGVAGAIWNVKMLPLEFTYDTATEVAALEYADQQGVKIINGSYGGVVYDPAEQAEMVQLGADGVLFVNAAGNESTNTDIAGANYPIGYALDNVMGVSATNRQDDITSFSTYGSVTVPVAAPGLQIVTTMTNSSYSTSGVDGTSFSAPYASGIAALIANYVTPLPDDLSMKARMIESASAGVDTNPPSNVADKVRQLVSGGRLDAASALTLTPSPSLTIEPVQVGSFSQYDPDTNTGDVISVPVIGPVVVNSNTSGSGVLEPGQAATLAITVKNGWLNATGVTGTLTADNGVTSSTGSLSFGDLADGQSSTGTFTVNVPSSLSGGHYFIHFALALSANGGAYQTTRNFILEVGTLYDLTATQGTATSWTMGNNLYDEYHTWHVVLNSIPQGADTLTFEAGAANDIDILVSEDVPPQYSIDLGACGPLDTYTCDPNALYFYNLPDAQTGAGFGPNSTEYVNMPITSADVGHTFYVTVVNFDMSGVMQGTPISSYQLEAFSNQGGVGGYPSSTVEAESASSSGGGGAFGVDELAGLGLLALFARRRRQAKN